MDELLKASLVLHCWPFCHDVGECRFVLPLDEEDLIVTLHVPVQQHFRKVFVCVYMQTGPFGVF